MSKKSNKAKKVSNSCRNHGTCPWCTRGRQYQKLRAEEAAEQQLREYERENAS